MPLAQEELPKERLSSASPVRQERPWGVLLVEGVAVGAWEAMEI